MKVGSIYIIKNKINDKVYIGQTTMTVHERFMVHLKPSTQKIRRNYKLYNAISKYGRKNFYVETLENNVPINELNEREIYYIALYNSYYNGYNSTKGGDGRIINKIENEDILLSLAKSGIVAEDIAKHLNVNKATVFRTLHKLGFYYHANQNQIVRLSVCRVWRRAPVFGGAQRRRLVYIIRAHVAWSKGIRRSSESCLKVM